MEKTMEETKDLFLEVTELDMDLIGEIYNNCIIRWISNDAPDITLVEMHERIVLYITEVARAYQEREFQRILEKEVI